jgi:hypothetical protein
MALSGRQLPPRVTERRTDVTTFIARWGRQSVGARCVAAYVWAMGMQQHALGS